MSARRIHADERRVFHRSSVDQAGRKAFVMVISFWCSTRKSVSGKQGAPCGCLMPVQSYRHGNHLHRETSLLQPKRTRGVDCPVSLQRITPTTVRRAAWPKAGNIAELDPEGGPREFARQANDRLSRTSFAFGSGHRAVGGGRPVT